MFIKLMNNIFLSRENENDISRDFRTKNNNVPIYHQSIINARFNGKHGCPIDRFIRSLVCGTRALQLRLNIVPT